MFQTLRRAAARGVTVGAHPGYADREGFGRRVIPMQPAEIGRLVAAQVGALQGVAAIAGATVRYVKPHGTLANLATDDRVVADAVAALPGNLAILAILAISGTELELAACAPRVEVFSEIFLDHAYLPNGRLMPRSRAGAVLHDAELAADRLLDFLQTARMPVAEGPLIELAAQSVCVHGDTPGAAAMAGRIRNRPEAAGISVSPFLAGAT